MKVKLGDVCNFYSGTGFPIAYQGKDSGELPFYKVGDIANNVSAGKIYLEFCNNYISIEEARAIKGVIIPRGTVVFAKIGEALKLNRRAISSCDCLIDNNAMGIAPISDFLKEKYFFYYMKHLKMQELAESTTVPSVRKSKLEAVMIEIPTLHEQERIEKQLDKISNIILMRKQQLQQLDELVKARFVELFGDPVTNEKGWTRLTLGDICEIGSSKRVFEKDYVSTGVPFFRTKEIVELSKGNKISTELFITKEHFKSLKDNYGVPKKDDLLISAVGTIGTIWIVSGDFEFYFKDGNLIQIKSSDSFNSIFMKCLLDELIANYKKEMSTGTAYSALTIAGLKKMLVYDVPLELQNEFADFVKQVDKSKFVLQKALDEAQTLFDSLMQEYFG